VARCAAQCALSLHARGELFVVAERRQVGHSLLEEGLGIRDRLIVDRRPELGENEVEQEPRLEGAYLLIHVLGTVRPERRDSLAPRVVRDGDRAVLAHGIDVLWDWRSSGLALFGIGALRDWRPSGSALFRLAPLLSSPRPTGTWFVRAPTSR